MLVLHAIVFYYCFCLGMPHFKIIADTNFEIAHDTCIS